MLASALEDCQTRHVTIQYLLKPRSLLTDGKQPGSRLEPFDFSYKEESSIINPIHTPYFGACLNKRESMSSKKYNGCCGAHAGIWILDNNALRAGYFWPTMKQNAKQLVNKCEKCQKHFSSYINR
ncbi:UNVERIFIED_CONTAM: hypothetical protein Slati_3672100 [Sesamum latifolium]|uniref:Integrase zinc-binding domain-containing protein n=1 Tax=Sesamum latifolium TaxID=2727402 RepID=A0AAW2U202_9LAMI